MAKYEFSCRGCGMDFELEIPLEERAGASVVCPGCGSREVKQVFRAVQINTRKASCDERGGCGAPCGRCRRDC